MYPYAGLARATALLIRSTVRAGRSLREEDYLLFLHFISHLEYLRVLRSLLSGRSSAAELID